MKPLRIKGSYSMRKLWTMLLILLSVIVTAGLFLINNRQRSGLVRQATQSYYESVEQFSAQMDSSLEQVEEFLYSAFYSNGYANTMIHSSDDIERYYAKQSLAALLNQVIQLNEFVEVAWFYQPDSMQEDICSNGEEGVFLARNNYTGISIRELQNMKKLILENLKNPSASELLQSNVWNLVEVSGGSYLLWMTPVGDTFCGAWVSIPYLFEILKERTLNQESDNIFICDSQGSALVQEGTLSPMPAEGRNGWQSYSHDSVNIGVRPEKADILFEKTLSRQEILKDTDTDFDYAMASTLILVFVCLTVVAYQLLIYKPFQALLENMETIRLGNMDVRLPDNGRFQDVATISRSINQLLDKNQRLNQEIYETQIRERDVQVQYLQIRLKAHFYMNGLSLIHAMARMKQNSLIQELSQCLIQYLRFIDVDTQKFVRLESELEHVKSYAKIQELRFPELFEYREDVSVELYDASIPPLMLQTFVENAVEHGMKQGEKNWIRIRAFYEERSACPGMKFEIQDNGTGFSPQDLQGFAAESEEIVTNQNHGIGIRNVLNRLKLLYQGKAEIRFGNRQEGGALIEIWLPLLDLEEEYQDEV